MRHNKKKGMKLGTDASHTKAIKRSLVRALFENDRIKTIDVRAKAIRAEVDHVITWAKKGDIASRRLAIATVGDKDIVREVFEKAAQGMWADRNGGYTRIMKLGPRKGDGAEIVIMELVTEPVKAKAKKATKKAAPKAAVTKVEETKAEELVLLGPGSAGASFVWRGGARRDRASQCELFLRREPFGRRPRLALARPGGARGAARPQRVGKVDAGEAPQRLPATHGGLAFRRWGVA